MKKFFEGFELSGGWQARAIFALAGFVMLAIAYLNFTGFKGLFVPVMIFLGLVCVFVYFFLYAKNEVINSYIYEFKPQPIWRGVLKVLNAFALAAAGLYLDIKKVPLIPYMLFFFSLLQVMLAARMKGMRIITYFSELLPMKDDKYLIKKMVLNFVLAVVVLIFLSKGMLFFSFVTLFVMAVITGDFFNNREFAGQDRDKTLDYILLGIILLAALFFRFYRLDQVPPGFTYDVRRAYDILLSMKRGEHFGVFLPQGDINAASMTVYLLYYYLNVFGFDIFNIRVLSVISSMAAIPFFYLLIKEIYNRKTAVFAVLFYSLMFNCILFSRLDNLLYFPVLILAAGLYFLLAGIKRGNIFFLVLAGVMAGLNMYTYHSGKMQIIILFIGFFIYGVDFKRIKDSWKNTANLFVICFAALVVFLPLLYFIVTQYGTFMASANNFMPKVDTGIFKYFFGNITDILFALTVKGSNYGYLNLPFRPVFTGIQQFLFVLGSAYLLFGMKKKENMLLIIWMFAAVLPEIFFTHHANPYYFRMILAFPVFAVIAALGCNVIYRYASVIWQGKQKIIYILIFFVVFVSSVGSSYIDYFIKYPKHSKVMDQFDYVASEIEKIVMENKGNIVYYSGYIQNIRSLFCVYCGDMGHIIKKDVSSLTISDFYTEDDKDVVIIAENIYAYYFDYLKEYFPDIVINKVENKEGLELWVDPMRPEFKYIVVKIPNEDIKKLYGLKAEFYTEGRLITEKIVHGSFLLPEKADRVVIKGLLDMPDYDRLKLSFNRGVSAIIRIDNAPYDGRKIYKGLHYFTAEINTGNLGAVDMSWEIKGNKTVVSVKNLINTEKIFGIQASYTFNFLDKKFVELEPIVENRYLEYMPKFETGGDSYFNVRWDGYFYAAVEGLYTFGIKTPANYCNSISVNEHEIYAYSGEKEQTAVYLKKGWHKLNIISYSQVIAFMNMVYRLQVKGPEDKAERTVYYNELSPFYH
ncbi:MAG: hypothetical protein CVV21_01655 [Candidatus Goldiibacteriota bacterium HGW-Goldbacteria-1]|jgi:4-amino-4-deoxy-L-arabinose transferase-like glycosyltransferase|nr:MAG: hypothetical protein CVV21_01655 [Candidatus Goldiibacteriota bacterium HGW-Goldbacteria-1]